MSCDSNASKLVVQALIQARKLNWQLTEQRYVAGSSDAKYQVNTFVKIGLALEVIMKECDQIYTDKKFLADISRVYNNVSKHLSSKYPEPMRQATKYIGLLDATSGNREVL